MELFEIFSKKHEIWLSAMYSSILIRDPKISIALYGFSDLFFRHMRWIGSQIVSEITSYDYDLESNNKDGIPKMFNFDRNDIVVAKKSGKELLIDMKNRALECINGINDDSILLSRIKSDDEYFVYRMEFFLNENNEILVDEKADSGFYFNNMSFSDDDIKKIKQVLSKQHQKEYVTVLSYLYVLIHTSKCQINEFLYDLMLESLYHQRHYAKMMASLGLLELPRVPKKEEYQKGDLKAFINQSIKEEIIEQEELRKISEEIRFVVVKNLVEYIANQEKHHIELLKKVLEYI